MSDDVRQQLMLATDKDLEVAHAKNLAMVQMIEAELSRRLSLGVFTEFKDALACWQDMGGVMNYRPGAVEMVQKQVSNPVWEVCSDDDSKPHIDRSREATVAALAKGGLSAEQIAHEMKTWSDE